MANRHERYGWSWTDEEREARKSPVRHAVRALEMVAQKASRIRKHLPAFAAKAEAAFHVLEGGLAPIVRLNIRNQGRKYQAISPEEADRLLSQLPALMNPWQELTASADFVAAVRETNRQIRAKNREIRARNAEILEKNRIATEKMAPIWAMIDRGDIDGALKKADEQGLL